MALTTAKTVDMRAWWWWWVEGETFALFIKTLHQVRNTYQDDEDGEKPAEAKAKLWIEETQYVMKHLKQARPTHHVHKIINNTIHIQA